MWNKRIFHTYFYKLLKSRLIKRIVIRGKDSLDDFTNSNGLVGYEDIIEFRP